MLSSLIRKRWPIPVALLVLVAGIVGVAMASSSDDGQTLVIYNGRSHYGDEGVFEDFEAATGVEVEVRGGSSTELFDRLEQEGDDTPADVLVTTDLSNLWRADEAGLLEPVTSPALEANVPEELHEEDGSWWALSTRMRVPMISTERVDPAEVTSYESLGDPQFEGRTCLRSSNNEYNQSLVADMLAKRGEDETRALLESWMANDPDILGSDTDLLSAIAEGDCDLGLTNHYYLARALEEDPDFPVAPAWPDQDGAGAHTNISGIGMIATTDQPDDVRRLMEFLTAPEADFITAGGELPANPAVPPPSHIADWAAVKQDPIAVNEAGPLLADAVELMLDVGWD
jgi:iron(III) transport system substrate-binding protein